MPLNLNLLLVITNGSLTLSSFYKELRVKVEGGGGLIWGIG